MIVYYKYEVINKFQGGNQMDCKVYVRMLIIKVSSDIPYQIFIVFSSNVKCDNYYNEISEAIKSKNVELVKKTLNSVGYNVSPAGIIIDYDDIINKSEIIALVIGVNGLGYI